MTSSADSSNLELFSPNLIRRPVPPASPRPASSQPAEEPTYSVSDINELVLGALRRQFPRQIWVRGEIQGYDLRKHRDTVSFTLAEKSADSDDVRASVTAIMFGDDRRAIDALLRQSENAFTLQDGIEVRFRVEVNLWVKAGRYQLQVRGIDPTYTLGRLAQNRKRIVEQLTQRGLLNQNKSVALPLVPLRVGVIGAKGSAGLRDFVTHLTQSGLRFSVSMIDAAMQGPQVEADVCRAIAHFNRTRAVDAIVITRGGGSATDLSWFDRLGLAEAIATSTLPVLTGLGHTHDTSVADIVAHANLKTPTDAAQFLINRVESFLAFLEDAARRLNEHATALLDETRAMLRRGGRLIAEQVRELVHTHTLWLWDRQTDALGKTRELVSLQWQFLDGCLQRLSMPRMRQMLGREHDRLDDAGRRLGGQTNRLLQRAREDVTLRRRGCTLPRLNRPLGRERQWLDHASSTVAMLDPARTLKRGFSIVRNAEGCILSSIAHVRTGESIATQVNDGSITSRVHSIEPLSQEESGG